jgi:hypothetical protein
MSTPIVNSKVEWRESLDQDVFLNDIVTAAKPVIFKGLTHHWPLTKAGADSNEALVAYLKRFNVDNDVRILIGNDGIKGRFFYNEDMSGFNFQEKRGPFGMALALLDAYRGKPSEPALYMGATSVAKVLPGMEVDNSLDIVADVPPHIWIGNAVTIAPHFDTSTNVACAVAGRRRFTLFPPEQVANLYVGPIEFNPAGQPISLVDLKQPDYERFPRFREALNHALVADLEPGDALFIPPLWWHNVESFDPLNVLVNYWWEPLTPITGSPLNGLMQSMLTIGHLPDTQKAAWRALFDHYVFSAEPPGEHLTPEIRGLMGALTPSLRDQVNEFLNNKTDGSR